jgi:hypothetical protein
MRTIQVMGSTRPEREAPLARTSYVAAARRFVQAFASVLAIGVPIDPGRDGAVREWSAADVKVLRELHAALGEMLEKRRSWDRLRHRRDSLR